MFFPIRINSQQFNIQVSLKEPPVSTVRTRKYMGAIFVHPDLIYTTRNTQSRVLDKCDSLGFLPPTPRSIVPATESLRILQERYGKIIRSCKKTRELLGTWKQHYNQEFFEFFEWFPNGSCWKTREVVGTHSLIPVRNSASKFLVFSVASWPFLAVRHSPGPVDLCSSARNTTRGAPKPTETWCQL